MIVTLPDAARSRQATRSSRAISRGVSMSPSPGCGLRRLSPIVDDTVTASSLTYPRQRPPRSSAGAAAPPPAAPRRLNQAPRAVPPAPAPSRSSISPCQRPRRPPAPRGVGASFSCGCAVGRATGCAAATRSAGRSSRSAGLSCWCPSGWEGSGLHQYCGRTWRRALSQLTPPCRKVAQRAGQ